jgi:DNA-binding NarL/FixJ family response regulator
VSAPVRIVIADDHALFRQGLRSLLQLREAVTVVGEVDRIDDLPAFLATHPCDVLLLDLGMERNTLAEIDVLASGPRVIVVTASERVEDAVASIRRGACGIVFKRYAIETLLDAIETVAAGHVWMPPEIQSLVAAELREPASESLTSREREIVRCVALGMRNAEVARKLFIAEVTVKTHLNNIFHKLALRDRVELTRYAIRIGLVGTDERKA